MARAISPETARSFNTALAWGIGFDFFFPNPLDHPSTQAFQDRKRRGDCEFHRMVFSALIGRWPTTKRFWTRRTATTHRAALFFVHRLHLTHQRRRPPYTVALLSPRASA